MDAIEHHAKLEIKNGGIKKPHAPFKSKLIPALKAKVEAELASKWASEKNGDAKNSGSMEKKHIPSSDNGTGRFHKLAFNLSNKNANNKKKNFPISFCLNFKLFIKEVLNNVII